MNLGGNSLVRNINGDLESRKYSGTLKIKEKK